MNIVAQLPPGLTGLEQLQKLISMGGRAPIGETLDFTIVEAGEGYAVFESTPGLRLYNPIGTVHGGYAATLLDSACGRAANGSTFALWLKFALRALRPLRSGRS